MESLRYSSIDGINMGAQFDAAGIECKSKEGDKLAKVMADNGGEVGPDGSVHMWLRPGKRNKELKTAIEIILRKDARRGNVWFLNVHANPASVFSGQNTFGNLKVKTQVGNVFSYVLNKLESMGAVVRKLRADVEDGEIYVHSITFAQYTKKLAPKTVEKLIDCWYAMYETRLRVYDNKWLSLLQALNIKRADGEQYESSINLAIYNDKGEQQRKLMHLCVYNKLTELQAKNKAPDNSMLADDLNSRLRFDLTVTNYFLRAYWNMPKVTIRALYDKVLSRWPDTKWKGAVEELMEYALRRTCLTYMLNAPNPFVNKKMIDLWKLGRDGRRWDRKLIKWSNDLGLNLEVSPTAHAIMLLGQAQLRTNTEELVTETLSGEGAERYLRKMGQAIEAVKTNKRLSSASRRLALDFSKPAYELIE